MSILLSLMVKLTASACRKRRIKCDEARPTCANCIKSKRQCEGYNQRVIFKDPLGAFAPYGPLVYPTPSPQALVREQQLSAAQQKSTSQSLQIIAPKPPQLGYLPGAIPPFNHVFPGQAAQVPSDPMNLDQNYYPTPVASKFTFFPPETVDAFSQNQWRQDPQRLEPQLNINQFPSPPQEDILGDVSPTTLREPPQVSTFNEDPAYGGVKFREPQYVEVQYPVYEDDEDASMDESEEDEPFPGRRESKIELNDLGLIVSQRLNDRYESFGMQPRTFGLHADDILAIYEPSPGNSPLNNKQTASVFWHFVNITGPSISLYERHPLDRVTYYQGQDSTAKQHIWTREYIHWQGPQTLFCRLN